MILFIAIGLAAGLLAGMFGIGGGIVIGPALILLASFAPQTATGTSLGALLLPVGALGAWEYYHRGHVNVAASLWIALGLFFGAWFGARIALSLSGPQLQKAFAIFLVLMAIRVWTKA
ncbi:MAG TPA: sulfite exporter TauE/SafE family protein [Gemmatimonadaceae bacterium]|nr:sulfite exporter TauE/SafE family protein [Gemmatimonadaceae bacterium]